MPKWDDGITWRTSDVTVDTEWLALEPQFVHDLVLRATSGGQEHELVQFYIRTATALGERMRGQHITPKTRQMVMSGFPENDGPIALHDAPVREITSITYIDEDGDVQTYGGSPVSYVFVPEGTAGPAHIELGDGESWPATATRLDAVTVTYEVGYAEPEDVPASIQQAIAVTVGELYKNPDLSNADGQVANVLGVQLLWGRRW